MLRTLILLALAAITFAFPVVAQDSPQSDEDLFGATETSVEAQDAQTIDRDEFLVWEAPRISGRLSGNVDYGWTWDDPWAFEGWAPDDSTMNPSLSSRLILQAKPEADWGYYAAFDLEYPLAKSAEIIDSDGDEATVEGIPNISIYSLYSTFSWEDALFFSFGKQPLRLGVGRFFQPADDLVSLSAVDVSDPEAEREGPLAFTALLPIPKTLSSASFWTVFPKGADSPDDAMYAAKFKYFFGDTELALAGAYKYDAPPSAFLLLNSGLWDLNVFGEFQLKYGSERTFLETRDAGDPLYPLVPFKAVEHDDRFFANATIGATYTDQESTLTIAGQYFWNGEAQGEATLTDGILALAASQAGPYAAAIASGTEVAPALDNLRWSAHYGAASIGYSEFFVEDLSASLTVLASLSDLSSLIMPRIAYRMLDFFEVSLSAALSFGEAGDEYTMSMAGPGEPSASVTLGFSVGAGSF